MHQKPQFLVSSEDYIRRLEIMAILIGIIFSVIFYLNGYNIFECGFFCIGIIIGQVPISFNNTLYSVIYLTVKRLIRRKILIKNLNNIIKLKDISAICCDKRDLFSQSSSFVKYVWFNDEIQDLEQKEKTSFNSLRLQLEANPLVFCALLCNNLIFLDTGNNVDKNATK